MATKRKPVARRDEPKEKALTKLYDAVLAYVRAGGGNVLVIGGVQVQRWPGERPLNWTLGIKCTGQPPAFAADGGAADAGN